jgi:acyl CoA:acetate/3-ketoacid CoA transferase alpha subunit
MRAGGAGIPAFYTPVGYGTDLAKGKEVRVFAAVSTCWRRPSPAMSR